MENLTTEQLLKELAKRGYVTDGLWNIVDAEMELDVYNEENGTSHTLTDEQKMDIVTDALMSDTIVESMYQIIGDKISDIFNNAI
jgi:hypothetical protein